MYHVVLLVQCTQIKCNALHIVQCSLFLFVAAVLGGCVDNDLRLIDGATMYEGVVEVCRNNVWGLITANDFGNTEAQQLCIQLGFPSECEEKVLCSIPESTSRALLPW